MRRFHTAKKAKKKTTFAKKHAARLHTDVAAVCRELARVDTRVGSALRVSANKLPLEEPLVPSGRDEALVRSVNATLVTCEECLASAGQRRGTMHGTEELDLADVVGRRDELRAVRAATALTWSRRSPSARCRASASQTSRSACARRRPSSPTTAHLPR